MIKLIRLTSIGLFLLIFIVGCVIAPRPRPVVVHPVNPPPPVVVKPVKPPPPVVVKPVKPPPPKVVHPVKPPPVVVQPR